MVNIGIVGIGFMGVTHFKAIEKVKGGRVKAICSRDRRKLKGDWRKIQGNFGGSGGVQDLSNVTCYDRIDSLLGDPGVDLVDMCLPTPMHAGWSLRALSAGKHLLLEKPIALNLKDADRIVSTAKKHDRQFMVAHVLRYFPEFRLIKDLAESGEFGSVLAAHFKRNTSRPLWREPGDVERTGGPAIDLHIHDADFIQFLLGMPDAVSSTGSLSRDGIVEYLSTHYHYEGRSVGIIAEGGWLSQQGCPFEQSYEIYFEEATLKFHSYWGQSPVLLTRDGKTRRPRLARKDPFVAELQEAVDTVAGNRASRILGGHSARNSLLLCLKEIQSVRHGRRIRINPTRS